MEVASVSAVLHRGGPAEFDRALPPSVPLRGRRPRGLLDLALESWEQRPSRRRSLVGHVEQMEQRMKIWAMVRERIQQVQQEQARL